MAKYYNGTNFDDVVTGALFEQDVFSNFGIGSDTVYGGNFNDVFNLLVDEKTDTIDGGKGGDRVDYSASDRGLTIDLAAGKVTALFGGGLTEVLHYATVANLTSIEDATGSKFSDTLVGTSGNNILEGGAGADRIDGGVGSDTASYAHSTAGVQVNLNYVVQHGGDAEGDQLYNIENIIGSSQADTLIGNWAGNSVIEGGGGADVINVGNGVTTTTAIINGTFVVDGWHINENTASYLHSPSAVSIDLNQVVQHGGDAEGDQLYAIDKVLGSVFNDQITGNSANNYLNGEGGDDTFYYSGGWDWIDGGAGHNTYVVGQLPGTAGVGIEIDVPTNEWQYLPFSPVGGGTFAPLVGSFVYYSDREDFLTQVENFVGSQNGDSIDGSYVSSDIGTTIDGAGGDDYVTGSDGSDHLYGGSGGDHLWGQKGDDYLYGGTGDDYLFGVEGNDFLSGGDNNDWLAGGAGADVLDGGAGTNWADYSASPAGVTVQLERMTGGYYSHYTNFGIGSGGDAEGDTLLSIQNVVGSSYDDKLVGDYHDNVLNGGAGNNTLVGGGGNDTLIGGPGNDVMTGGGGLLPGASDADTFFFQLYSESGPATIGNDTITDYQPGIDKIELANLNAAQGVHVAQDHDNAVITMDNVVGSITVLNTHAADVHWTV